MGSKLPPVYFARDFVCLGATHLNKTPSKDFLYKTSSFIKTRQPNFLNVLFSVVT